MSAGINVESWASAGLAASSSVRVDSAPVRAGSYILAGLNIFCLLVSPVAENSSDHSATLVLPILKLALLDEAL